AVLALALGLAGPDRQGRAIAVYAIARHLPLFLFGPVAGVVVDRLDRRRVMIAADVARAVLALGFLLAYRFASLALVYAVGARLGTAAAQGLGARPRDFGISVLFVAMGLGGVLGAPLAKRFNAGGAGLGARMGRSLLFDGCGLALFSFMPRLWPAALVLVAR